MSGRSDSESAPDVDLGPDAETASDPGPVPGSGASRCTDSDRGSMSMSMSKPMSMPTPALVPMTLPALRRVGDAAVLLDWGGWSDSANTHAETQLDAAAGGGPDALLRRSGEGSGRLAAVLRAYAALNGARARGELVVDDLVPVSETLLVMGGAARTPKVFAAWLSGALARQHPQQVPNAQQGSGAPGDLARTELVETVEIPTVYDGEDLAEVARLSGLSEEEVVARHTTATYDVAFAGFAPGFAYLAGGDPALIVPRRATPRARIPAGAVGLAGAFSGVYPRASPGGWQLIGRTDLPMWNLERERPATLVPGMRARFMPVRAYARAAHDEPAHRAMTPPDAQTTEEGLAILEIVDPGFVTLMQDDGRPGLAELGVGIAGAADRGALRRANRLVGNAAGATVLEIGPGDFSAQVVRTGVLALTGAPRLGELTWTVERVVAPDAALGSAPDTAFESESESEPDRDANRELDSDVDLDADRESNVAADEATHLPKAEPEREERERAVPTDAPFRVSTGETLRLRSPERGMRTVLAVRGGILAASTLGSASRDTLAGLGPAPAQRGDVIAVGPAPSAAVQLPDTAQRTLPASGDLVTLRVIPGPRDAWFANDLADEPGVTSLLAREWTVTPASDRVGLRLAGEPLRRAEGFARRELPSEGTVTGAIQVPPDGLPVLFLADRPVTGGYPVIAVVADADLDLAAQLPPGARVRFTISPGCRE